MTAGKALLPLAVTMWFALVAAPVRAFNADTHKAMNWTAAQACPGGQGPLEGSPLANFCLDRFLRNELGFSLGVDESLLNRKNVLWWLQYGGEHEDDPSWNPFPGRYMNHFHDPLVEPWSDAGLKAIWTSSIIWMQQDGQGWSWPEARRFYYAALTAKANSSAREQAWANTFRALGQIMHLVEDAGSPAHVRNDPHGMESFCRDHLWGVTCFPNFEYWVSEHGGYSFSGAPPFNRDVSGYLFQATGVDEAMVPIAHLIDTNTYTGTNPSITTGSDIGLAEFTNSGPQGDDGTFGTFHMRSRSARGMTVDRDVVNLLSWSFCDRRMACRVDRVWTSKGASIT